MRFKVIIVVAFVSLALFSGNANADDLLAGEAAYWTLHIMDWGQTLEIARHPEKYYELNPILGRHPGVGKVNTYFLITGIGHTLISAALPKKYRRIWQWFTIGIESSVVLHNFRIGLKVRF